MRCSGGNTLLEDIADQGRLRLKLINDIGFRLMPSSGTDNASTRIIIREYSQRNHQPST